MAASKKHPTLKECLFHYTSAGGLKGILESGCIWASDSAFLNDSSEVKYAGQKVENHLKNLIKEFESLKPKAGSDESRRLIVLNRALDTLTKFNNAEDERWLIDGATYVSCFTEMPDQLSQWRGYGGRGYSLGFTKKGLNDLAIEGEDSRAKSAGESIKVGYGPRRIEEKLNKNLSELFKTLPLRRSFRFTGMIYAHRLLPALARFKHEAFEEEQEWRVAVSTYGRTVNKINLREGARLVPYIKLRFNPSALAYVYIGPGADFHDKRALHALLAANGYDADRVWIEHSSAPFRDT
jgi:hypothetical protein